MLTTTVGGTTSGYCETGSPKYASPPSSVIRMLSTAAKMGRWMKKLEDMPRGGRYWRVIFILSRTLACPLTMT